MRLFRAVARSVVSSLTGGEVSKNDSNHATCLVISLNSYVDLKIIPIQEKIN